MPTFSESYIALREKEGRLLSDDQVKQLPNFRGSKSQEKEWKLRSDSCNRFLNYLKQSKPESFLEIGCGNGWFAAKMATVSQAKVLGVDVNQIELDQAMRVFGNVNLVFVNASIFASDFENKRFDIIVLNASIQYFSELKELIERLRALLNVNGEIHMLDSPFYKKEEIVAARERSKAYYAQNGFPELADHYFHHSLEEMMELGAITLYKPATGIIGKVRRQNPFPWLMLKKQ